MELKIVNKARHLIIVPLNSGKTVHLAPGETSQSIAVMEINGNAKIAKLQKTNLISTVLKEEKPIKSGGGHKKGQKKASTSK